MAAKKVVSIAVVLGLCAGGVFFFIARKYLVDCTAKTFLEVIPPLQLGPSPDGYPSMEIGQASYLFRVATAEKIKGRATFEEFLSRESVRNTRWFKRFGESSNESIKKAIENLSVNFGTAAYKDTDRVELWMTCYNRDDAALLVDEMVEMFVSKAADRNSQIDGHIKQLEDQRAGIRKELESLKESRDAGSMSPQKIQIIESRSAMLKAIDEQIDKLNVVKNDSPSTQYKRVSTAPSMRTRVPFWAVLSLPAGGLLGLMVGIVLSRFNTSTFAANDQ